MYVILSYLLYVLLFAILYTIYYILYANYDYSALPLPTRLIQALELHLREEKVN
jgi:hypothetical protein